jgi:hypothetical protein
MPAVGQQRSSMNDHYGTQEDGERAAAARAHTLATQTFSL